jgi:hypothetical protein
MRIFLQGAENNFKVLSPDIHHTFAAPQADQVTHTGFEGPTQNNVGDGTSTSPVATPIGFIVKPFKVVRLVWFASKPLSKSLEGCAEALFLK